MREGALPAKVHIGLPAVFGYLCTVAVAAADPAPLGQDALRAMVPGAHIELDTPLNSVVPIRFAADGLMTGEANGLGSYLGSERDRGRWRIVDDQLCLKWFRWFDAEERCLTLRREDKRIHWQEVEGKSGTATIIVSGEEVAKATSRFAVASIVAIPSASPPPAQIKPAQPPEPPETAASATPETAAPAQPTPAALANLSIISRAEAATPPPADVAPAAAPPGVKARPKAAPAKQAAPQSGSKKAARSKDQAAKSAVRVSSTTPAAAPRETTYQVAHVADDDVLNVRDGPSEYHDAIAVIPPAARGVRIVGECEDEWCPIAHGRSKGWVNRYYLSEEQPEVASKRAPRPR